MPCKLAILPCYHAIALQGLFFAFYGVYCLALCICLVWLALPCIAFLACYGYVVISGQGWQAVFRLLWLYTVYKVHSTLVLVIAGNQPITRDCQLLQISIYRGLIAIFKRGYIPNQKLVIRRYQPIYYKGDRRRPCN